jgi:hypothetical protein
LFGVVALPCALLIVTTLIFIEILALPFLWMIIIMWWVNSFGRIVSGENGSDSI